MRRGVISVRYTVDPSKYVSSFDIFCVASCRERIADFIVPSSVFSANSPNERATPESAPSDSLPPEVPYEIVMSVIFPINRVASRQDSLNEIVSVVEGAPAEEFEASSPFELLPHPLSRITTKQDINKRATIS